MVEDGVFMADTGRSKRYGRSKRPYITPVFTGK